MNLDCVIVSANEDANYLPFWPLTAQAWNRILPEAEIILAFITDRNEDDILIKTLRQFGTVIPIKPVEGIATGRQAKIFRHLTAARMGSKVCMLSDVDLVPLRSTYIYDLIDARRPDHLLQDGYDWYVNTKTHGKAPLVYSTAEGHVWRDILTSRLPAGERAGASDAQILDTYRKGAEFDAKEAIQASKTFSDESLLRALLSLWDGPHIQNRVNGGYDKTRLDRAHGFDAGNSKKLSTYVDAHLPRPLSKNRDRLQPLAEFIGAEQWDCMQDGWDHFTAPLELAHTGKAVVRRRGQYPFIGSDWGGTWLDTSRLTEGMPGISAGLGRDVSFDIELINQWGCCVIGVDPTEEALQTVKKHKLLENPSSFELVRKAVTGTCGQTVMLGGPARTALSPVGEKAETISLGKLVQVYRPGFIKLDIEGSEYDALNGVLEELGFLHKHGVQQMVIGFHFWLNGPTDLYPNPGVTNPHTQSQTMALLDRLADAGFKTVLEFAECGGRFPQEALLVYE